MKKFVFVLLAIVLFFVFFSTGEEEETTSNASSEATKETVSEETTVEEKEEDILEKEYAIGETASYEGYEVTVNSVEFTDGGDESYLLDSEDNKFVVVNVTITNNTDDVASFNSYDFQLNDNGVKTDMDEWLDVENELPYGDLDVGASITGNIVGEGNPNNKLKLEYETSFWGDETVDFLLN